MREVPYGEPLCAMHAGKDVGPLVYVDSLRQYPSGHWCHMTADHIEELHQFAAKLGIPRRGFQNKGYKWHYDLDPLRRSRAIQRGAQQITSRDMVRLMQARNLAADGAVEQKS